jgi:hypothetical protein
MTTTIGLRELSRGVKAFEGYDYVRIEDKKTKKNKGLIISEQYAYQVEQIVADFITKQKQQELDEIMQFAGSVEIEERFQGLDMKEIRQKIAQEKYGK